MALITTKDRKEFEEKVLNNDKLVLVDFWAQWCPPCRMMAPILEKVASDKDAKLDVVKIDIEESPDNQSLAVEYGVQGIPNMQVFRGGKVIKELVGARPAHTLTSELEALEK